MANQTFSPKQKKALLLLVGVLLCLRFVAVPLIDYQAELKQQIRLESRQLERAIALLSEGSDTNKQSHELSVDAIKNDLKQAESMLPRHVSESQFKLEQQQRLEQLANDQGLSIEVFDWLGIVPTAGLEDYLMTYQGQIEVEGALTDLVRFQTQATQSIYSINWQEMTLRTANSTVKKGELRVPVASATMFFTLSGINILNNGTENNDNKPAKATP